MKQKEFNQKWYDTVLSKMILLFLIGTGFFPGVVHAQVTIGSGLSPAEGALLDVKQHDASTTGGDTSTKGVLFPRVSLTDLTSLSPLVANADPASKATHKGIVVYNVSKNLKEGLYCWDGAKWVCVSQAWELGGNAGTDPAKDYIGTSDAKALSIRTDDTERIRVGEDGKTYLKKVDPMASANVSQLVVDNTTGEISTLVTKGNNKALNYIVYKIECASVKGKGYEDWIADFDTKIKEDFFTLVVVGSSYQPQTEDSGLIVGVADNKPAGSNGTFSSTAVYAFTKEGTWRLKADYVAGKPIDGLAGTWLIYCLAINKSMVQELKITNGTYPGDKSKFQMKTEVGAAADPPVGLYTE